MADKRLRKVSASISDDGSEVTYNIFGPADDTGKQPIASTTAFTVSQLPADRYAWFALYGLSQVVANSYNRPSVGDTPAEVLAVVNSVLADVASGQWSPGRSGGFAEREPTDLELAMAEVMGRSVEDIMEHVADDIQREPDGSPKLDKRGRTMRVFTARMLASIAEDPAVKPVYARLVAERAKRLGAEAKSAKGGESKLAGLFGQAAPATEPVPAAAQ
jgi:hypothetical protein